MREGRALRRSTGGGGRGGARCDDVCKPQGEGGLNGERGTHSRGGEELASPTSSHPRGRMVVAAATPGNGDEPYAAGHPINQQDLLSVSVTGSAGAPRAAGSSGLRITDPSSVQSSERSGGGWRGLIYALCVVGAFCYLFPCHMTPPR